MAVNFPVKCVQKSCDLVVNSVRASFLNFSIQETPYSLYLTIRKSFSKYSNQQTVCCDPSSELVILRVKFKSLEDANLSLKNNYEEAINECEVGYKVIRELETKIENYEIKLENKNKDKVDTQKRDQVVDQVNQNLAKELERAEKNWKDENKNVKAKEKEIYDLKKENDRISHHLGEIKTEHTSFLAKVNKEEKNREKKLKKSERKEFLENLTLKYECDRCDFRMETLEKLKHHKRNAHMKISSTQTEGIVTEEKSVQQNQSDYASEKSMQTIEDTSSNVSKSNMKDYSCFYCNKKIISEIYLMEHRKSCRGSTRLFCTSPVGLPANFSISLPPPRRPPSLLWPYM